MNKKANGTEIIYIEGMDLSGKTTLAKNLSRIITGWSVRTNSLTQQNPIWELADDLRKRDKYDDYLKGLLYCAALKADIIDYEQNPGEKVIQDSTIAFRSLAYHKVGGSHDLVEVIERSIVSMPNPRIVIYLYASMSKRAERLNKKQTMAPDEVARDDLMVLNEPERFCRMERVLRSSVMEHFKAFFIDTSEMDENQVCQYVLNILTKEGVIE